MEWLHEAISAVLHLDQHLAWLVQNYGAWIYLILFAIVFAETGLVVTPFLPGDSLLFVAGTLAAVGGMSVGWLWFLLIVAAILGDSVNYAVGKYVGPRVFYDENARFFKRAHLERTQHFYEKHGAKTIVLARFVPIVRTFAPFVAGIGQMHYARFLSYNVIGAVVWVTLFVFGGYLFGNLPWVKQNLSAILLGIIVLSIMPLVIEFVRARRR